MIKVDLNSQSAYLLGCKAHFPPMWRYSQAALGGTQCVCVEDTLMCRRFFLSSALSLSPMARLASFKMQWAASANALAKGAGSECGACEAFDFDDWMQPSISPSLSS